MAYSPKYALGLPVSPPRSPNAPMSYQAGEPTYALKPHIIHSHTIPQTHQGCAKIPSLHSFSPIPTSFGMYPCK